MVWVFNRLIMLYFEQFADAAFNGAVFDRNPEIAVEDVLSYTDWPFIDYTKTSKDIALLCIATAIIAEHSYFLWNQNPSASSAPFKSAIQKFNLVADIAKIETAIQEASHLQMKDKKHALVEIALKNCLDLDKCHKCHTCLYFPPL
ncbi:uncharacterized protein LACBIDRAFT_330502 [Laccaria bicolor S238N-H82]|uniref:Predicted protein n=1 Tax=Laccaria bicolor (strain S238N-H82 / ATCC MYA-4686) TaxID=486041 RepID=B0DLH3_LACBS|nr:uncharacterized protein LACBIDRAFT_330502 [Laccaria bicolor S238N-H82]EDR04648.1 predicted protein [Laccaria bicolor S238N-H82]|eukprot:XP_001884820.1 predicted protein [Laccaria bicolor S238N-H82]